MSPEESPPETENGARHDAISDPTAPSPENPITSDCSHAAAYFDACGYRPDELISVNWKTPTGRLASAFVAVTDAPGVIAEHLDADCYVSAGTLQNKPTAGRGTAADIARIPSLWADLDLKDSGFPDYAEMVGVITEISDLIGGRPAVVLLTGGGMQPRWRLAGDIDADTLERFGLLVEQVCAAHGYQRDNVYDLPRILRAPASVNHKRNADGTYKYGDGPTGTLLTVADGEPAIDADRLRKVLDDRDATLTPAAPTRPAVAALVEPAALGQLSPGDDFNLRAEWADILQPAGWQRGRTRADGTTEWTRPGKHPRDGISATTGYGDQGYDLLYVFTSSTEFEADRSYDKFGAYCQLRHGGNWSEATRELRRSGYGDPLPVPERYNPLTLIYGDDQEGIVSPSSLAETAEQTLAGPWLPLDLSDVVAGLLAGTLARPTPTVGLRDDGAALFYPRSVNGVQGTSGCGKTITALTTCAQQLAAGRHVVYIDFEADAAVIVGRLLDLGAEPDAVTARFHYLNPDVRLDPAAQVGLFQLIREVDPSLVVIDSTGESMALEGDRPNDDDDTVRWFNRLAKPISRLGPAVVVIDHMTKADESALYASGSHRKRGAITGAAYTQVTIQEFAKGKPGSAKLVCSKDRHGTFVRGQKVATLTVAPGDGNAMRVTLIAPPDDGADGDRRPLRPTALMERVSLELEKAAGATSTRGVLALVRGKEKYVTSALRTLVAEGFVTEEDGPRGAHLYSSTGRYRQANDPQSDCYEPGRQSPSSDRMTVRLPLGGETGDRQSPSPGDGRATVGDGQTVVEQTKIDIS